MVRQRRYLVRQEVSASREVEFAAAQEQQLAACPDAAVYSDEQAEEFLWTAEYLDHTSRQRLVSELLRARIAFPPELTYDSYRLGRYLLRRWGEPAIREAYLRYGFTYYDIKQIARLKRAGDLQVFLSFVNSYGPVNALWLLRRHGMEARIPEVVAAFSPEQAARHRALMSYARLIMYRFLTEPEPSRQPSRWEQQKLARRVRLRDVQLHSMRKSLHTMGQDRRELLARLREVGRPNQPELDALAKAFEEIRLARAEAEQRHAAALAEQARQYQERMARLQAELAAARQDYSEWQALRSSWLPVPRRG
jgi:hypothetical protein